MKSLLERSFEKSEDSWIIDREGNRLPNFKSVSVTYTLDGKRITYIIMRSSRANDTCPVFHMIERHSKLINLDYLPSKVHATSFDTDEAFAKAIERIEKLVATYSVTEEQIEFLRSMVTSHTGANPLARSMMSKDEIRISETLVKKGLLIKGTSVHNKKVKVFYAEDTPDIRNLLSK